MYREMFVILVVLIWDGYRRFLHMHQLALDGYSRLYVNVLLM